MTTQRPNEDRETYRARRHVWRKQLDRLLVLAKEGTFLQGAFPKGDRIEIDTGRTGPDLAKVEGDTWVYATLWTGATPDDGKGYWRAAVTPEVTALLAELGPPQPTEENARERGDGEKKRDAVWALQKFLSATIATVAGATDQAERADPHPSPLLDDLVLLRKGLNHAIRAAEERGEIESL